MIALLAVKQYRRLVTNNDTSSCLDGQMRRRNRSPPYVSHPGGQAQLLRPYLLPRSSLGVGECVGKCFAQDIVGTVNIGMNPPAIFGPIQPTIFPRARKNRLSLAVRVISRDLIPVQERGL